MNLEIISRLDTFRWQFDTIKRHLQQAPTGSLKEKILRHEYDKTQKYFNAFVQRIPEDERSVYLPSQSSLKIANLGNGR